MAVFRHLRSAVLQVDRANIAPVALYHKNVSSFMHVFDILLDESVNSSMSVTVIAL